MRGSSRPAWSCLGIGPLRAELLRKNINVAVGCRSLGLEPAAMREVVIFTSVNSTWCSDAAPSIL